MISDQSKEIEIKR